LTKFFPNLGFENLANRLKFVFFFIASTSGKPGSNKGSPESCSSYNGSGCDATPEVSSAFISSAVSVVVIVVVVVRATMITPLWIRTAFVSLVKTSKKKFLQLFLFYSLNQTWPKCGPQFIFSALGPMSVMRKSNI